MIAQIVNKLRSQFAQWLVKSNPAARHAVEEWQRGNPLGYPSDPDAVLQSVNVNVWAYVAINTIGKNLSAAPLIVERQETVDSEKQWRRIDSGPLVDLVRSPNEREPMDVLLWRTMMSLLSGDAYWVRGDDGKSVYHVHTPLVRVIPDAEGLQGYMIGKPPKEQYFEPEQVVHFALPNPAHEFYGLSPLESAKQHVLIDYHYVRWLKRFFKNGALPLGWLSTDQNIDEDAIRQTRAEWNKIYGGDHQHSIGIGGNGIKYENISPPLADLVVDTLHKMPREAILAAFGMPPVLAGIFEYANYANSKEQIKIFWENTILPKQRLIAGFINIQLVPQYGDNLRLRFDTSRIAALQEDQKDKASRLTILVGGRILTPNEARQEYDLEPVDGGDELQAAPTSQFGIDWMPGGDDGGKALGQPSPEPVSVISRAVKNPVQDAHEKNVKRLQRNLVVLIRRFFDQQLDRLLDHLEEISIDGKPISSLLYSFLLSRKDADDDARTLFNISIEDQELLEIVDPFIRDAVKREGDQAIARLGIEGSFQIDNPEVQTIIDGFVNRIKKINDATYDDIKEILRAGYDEGLGIDEIERRLRDKYSQFSKDRSRRIAATEMSGMVNGGAHEAYKQNGIEKKRWRSAFLPTSRQAHMDADGQTVDINDKFIVGNDLMDFPGDPEGSVGNIVNCYCGYDPVME